MQGEQSQALYYLLAVFKKKKLRLWRRVAWPRHVSRTEPRWAGLPPGCARSQPRVHSPGSGQGKPFSPGKLGGTIGKRQGNFPPPHLSPWSPSPAQVGILGSVQVSAPPRSPHGPGNLELHGCQFRVPLGFLQPCLLLLG